ncbi:sulfatase-like hydrolase/transferase [Lacinutrix sp. MedPE-SW]|uniref:sulfatase-like hydrolase/transferase n=1 Tax=Lacinutrix sp. MedPE-SW TaxID=1860087 RepID=UPI00090ED565|nr:sulfatase-like hydrolase/transferase [Lacinutrix sp. MedPE-SW]OIQ22343.1 MAG: hypothetical protein BM549_07565 [Lacinutrix sp. MedPE-SW]
MQEVKKQSIRIITLLIKHLFKQIQSILSLVCLLSLPLLVIIVLGWFVMPFTYVYLKEVIAFGFLTAIFSSIFLFFKSEKLRKWYLLFSVILLSVLAVIKLSFYINYGVKISSSILFVIFETNRSEASDFLSNYFNVKIIGLILFFIALVGFSVVFLKQKKLKNLQFSFPIKALGLVSILIALFFIFTRFNNENLLYTTITSYEDYTIAKANLKAALAKENTKTITVTNTLNIPQTYVVVIGESTSSWHMQLYGYDRETNPKLKAIEKELVVFDSVITPNVHTIVALEKILTLADYNAPKLKDNASIVQLANNAGFETFWISNQKPVGLHESIPTLIGNAAKNKNFVTTEHSAYNIYDEALLPYLKKALDDKAKKKMIFLHLIGNHSAYKRRYPEQFNKFKNNKKNTKANNIDALESINFYDNATLYNDYIIREVIEAVRAKNTNSFVLYLSDHGDEVFDTISLVGHNEFHATRPMYEVPFIVWFSKAYKSSNKDLFTIKGLKNRPYMLDDFFHSFSDLSRINFEGFNPEKSIFNKRFKKKERLIKKGINYDKR